MKHRDLKYIALALALLLVIMAGGMPAAADAPDAESAKKGILLVTFGTTYPEARKAYENIEARVTRAFPQTPIRWAYTSHIIRKKMAESGNPVSSPARALAQMAGQGFTHVAVQSLHTIAGKEYHDLLKTVAELRRKPGGIRHIEIGRPLLAGPHDMERAARAIMDTLPKERKPDEAVILVGHGTHHGANAAYPALMWRLQLADPQIYIGTVEGFPGPDTILEQLGKNGIRTAWLMPFMSVAGDHARNDLAGSGKRSWKSRLTDTGIECRPVLKGTAEFDAFADIWVTHLAAAIKKL